MRRLVLHVGTVACALLMTGCKGGCMAVKELVAAGRAAEGAKPAVEVARAGERIAASEARLARAGAADGTAVVRATEEAGKVGRAGEGAAKSRFERAMEAYEKAKDTYEKVQDAWDLAELICDLIDPADARTDPAKNAARAPLYLPKVTRVFGDKEAAEKGLKPNAVRAGIRPGDYLVVYNGTFLGQKSRPTNPEDASPLRKIVSQAAGKQSVRVGILRDGKLLTKEMPGGSLGIESEYTFVAYTR